MRADNAEHHVPPAAHPAVSFMRLVGFEVRFGLPDALFALAVLLTVNVVAAVGIRDDANPISAQNLKQFVALLTIHFGPWIVPLVLAQRSLGREVASNTVLLLRAFPVHSAAILGAKLCWLTLVSFTIAAAATATLWSYHTDYETLYVGAAFPPGQVRVLAFASPLWLLPLTPAAFASLLLGRLLADSPGARTWIAGTGFLVWLALWVAGLSGMYALQLHWPGIQGVPFVAGAWALPEGMPLVVQVYTSGYLSLDLLLAHVLLTALLTLLGAALFDRIDW